MQLEGDHTFYYGNSLVILVVWPHPHRPVESLHWAVPFWTAGIIWLSRGNSTAVCLGCPQTWHPIPLVLSACHDQILFGIFLTPASPCHWHLWPQHVALYDSLATIHPRTIAKELVIWTGGNIYKLPAFCGQDLLYQNLQACIGLDIWFKISQAWPLWVVMSPPQYCVTKASQHIWRLLQYFCDTCSEACVPSFIWGTLQVQDRISWAQEHPESQPVVNVYKKTILWLV